MLQSMTGYGKSEVNTENLKISVEIKTLNSKSLDLFLKISTKFRSKELELRKIIGDKLQRGKIDFCVYVENLVTENNCKINKNTVKNYISQLEDLHIEGTPLDFLTMAIKMPDVFVSQDSEINEEEWKIIVNCVNSSIDKVINFREEEGKSLETVLKQYTFKILEYLTEIEKFEKERIETVQQKFEKSLKELQVQVDEQRFHQEMIYYIEKLDINEEKNRLQQHCKYFLEVIEGNEQIGKKLGFIAQEMGREINTIGSKANHSEIQKLVVLMKEELEKIKEQTNNVL